MTYSRHPFSRRQWLARTGGGVGSLALAWLLKQEGLLATSERLEARHYDLVPKRPPQPPRARAMISLFMQGGPSHIDLFDPKPELDRLNGKDFPGEVKYDDAAGASREVMASPWKFSKHGQCGMELSELVPHLAKVVDDITLIRSMHTGVNNHGQSIYAMENGRSTGGRPTLGSWLTYGLGSENQDLPAYVALTDPRGLPVLGVDNWTNGWLPSVYQGTVVRSKEPRILNLDAPMSLKGEAQDRYLSYLGRLNQKHLQQRPGETDLEARIQSFELAARMQTAAKEALDISQESESTKKLYGLDDPATQEYGTRCLIARRLVERGVRFVSVFTANQTWDHHLNLLTGLPAAIKQVDKPSAALVIDLKARGLLDSTVVHWGGEMGRLPVIQNRAGGKNDRSKVGRDHNTYGFSMWVAGGGFKRGYVHGETDEWSHRALVDEVKHYDWHATLLRAFGIDHNKLTYKRNGLAASLTDNQGAKVVEQLLA